MSAAPDKTSTLAGHGGAGDLRTAMDYTRMKQPASVVAKPCPHGYGKGELCPFCIADQRWNA